MEKKEELISVIVPVYNGEHYLADCIESIEQQTYRNLEIIIINDGSTDGTGKICETLREIYPNISVITLADEGVSAARNAGIEASEGNFITFVDADDRLLPDTMTILYACMTETGSDIAGCHFFAWENEAQWRVFSPEEDHPEEKIGIPRGEEMPYKLPVSEQETAPVLFTPPEYIKNELLQGNTRCWSKLYKRELIGDVRFRRDLYIGEDMLFLFDLMPGAGKIAEITYRGYGYYQNPDGAINRRFTPKYMDQITCWELVRDQIKHMEKTLDENHTQINKTGEDSLYVQATSLLIMGIMLTAGKIAVLSEDERRRNRKYTAVCHTRLKEAMRIPGAYRRLSKGYQMKALFFRYLPGVYLWLYHKHKQ